MKFLTALTASVIYTTILLVICYLLVRFCLPAFFVFMGIMAIVGIAINIKEE